MYVFGIMFFKLLFLRALRRRFIALALKINKSNAKDSNETVLKKFQYVACRWACLELAFLVLLPFPF